VNYCGIDLAGLSSYVYITDKRGEKLHSGFVETSKESFAKLLKPYMRFGMKVAIEAGNQTAWVYETLVKLGAKVTVVNPTKVKLIAESRRKTDKVDAKVLCELLRLDGLPNPVHMPGPEMRALRGLLAGRRQLVSMRTKCCNVVRGMLRQEGFTLPPRALSTARVWQTLALTKFEQTHLIWIVAAFYIVFEALSRAISWLDSELAKREKSDPRVARLKTIPKVGRIASLTFLAAVDDVGRFSSARKLVSYAGLAPTVRSSGEQTQYGPITREGRGELRAVWLQIAHLVAHDTKRATQPLRTWYNRIARKRGPKTALVALTRRLLVIAYHMLSDGTDYDPTRIKRPPRRGAPRGGPEKGAKAKRTGAGEGTRVPRSLPQTPSPFPRLCHLGV
jgi:transposase